MSGEVDLRSDTVTRPTPAMRRAMAEAIVGDDVFGDDPTVMELERRMAQLTGKAAALYVPSGTMGNQLAVACHTTPGDEVLLDAQSHVFLYEQAGIAALSGCLAHPVSSARGVLDPALVHGAVRDSDIHVARLTLLCLENTHNGHGGAIVPLEALHAVADAARGHGMRVHLDGARLWNAAVATRVPLSTWAAPADSVMTCFSKGLGAPIGSILAGTEQVVLEARRLRKRWGGGMRQVGILAAACLHAIEHHVERMAEDHRRARRLADALRDLPGVRVNVPDTNTVLLRLEHPSLDRDEIVRALHARGVRLVTFGHRQLRAITHLDIDDAAIERAIEVMHATFAERLAAGAH